MSYISVEVDVDISEFSDEEIREEYEERNLGSRGSNEGWTDHEILTKIWLHDREGRQQEAYSLMREYVLNKLGKVV